MKATMACTDVTPFRVGGVITCLIALIASNVHSKSFSEENRGFVRLWHLQNTVLDRSRPPS